MLSMYIKIIRKEKIFKYIAISKFLYTSRLTSFEKNKKTPAIRNEKENVIAKILQQTDFILLKFFPANKREYSGTNRPLKEFIKKLQNNKTGMTIPFINPYFEIAKEQFKPEA